jgi:hypothetical protein
MAVVADEAAEQKNCGGLVVCLLLLTFSDST